MMDNHHKAVFVSFFSMELFWLFAWAGFLMKSTADLAIPVAPFLMAYFLSFATASGFKRNSLRLIWVVLGHAVMFFFVTALALWSATGSFFPPGPGVYEWYRSGLTGAITGLFWYKGTKLCFRQMSYKMVCNYFDLGLALFFALVLIKLLVFYQSGIRLPDAFLLYLLAGFFFTGLAAIFFSNSFTTRKKQYVEGFRGAGVMISFCMVFLLCGMGLAFVLMPVMTSMADSGYTVLKEVTGTLSPYLISILRFILTVPKSKGGGTAVSQDPGIQDPYNMGMTGEAGWFFNFVFYGFLSVIVAVAVVLLGTLILRMFRFLMQKPLPGPAAAGNTRTLWSMIKGFIRAVMNFFRKFMFIFFSRIKTAQAGFSRLMAWGRKSGVKRGRTETPGEYAKRLQALFLPLENEIFTIVHAFHLETYGERTLTGPELDRVIKALKKMHHPSFWGLRIKAVWRAGP